jgi:hypothetical protein
MKTMKKILRNLTNLSDYRTIKEINLSHNSLNNILILTSYMKIMRSVQCFVNTNNVGLVGLCEQCSFISILRTICLKVLVSFTFILSNQ